MEVVLIGHAGHPEVEITMGQYWAKRVAYLVERPEGVQNLVVNDQLTCTTWAKRRSLLMKPLM